MSFSWLPPRCDKIMTTFSNTSKGFHCEEQCDIVQSITVAIIITVRMEEILTFGVSEFPE